MDVCPRVFCVCNFVIVVAALRQIWSPVQGVLHTLYMIHSSRLILMGNRPEGLIWKVEEEELNINWLGMTFVQDMLFWNHPSVRQFKVLGFFLRTAWQIRLIPAKSKTRVPASHLYKVGVASPPWITYYNSKQTRQYNYLHLTGLFTLTHYVI
jgi:hypothetical protein